jgi:5-hydroxyisourate hydrolase-like protein (transthyretin family)
MRYLMVLMVVLGWVGLTTLTAQACSCFAPGPPCEAYGSASAVFAGTVVSVRLAEEPKPGPVQPINYLRVFKFSVDQAYLGVAGTEVEAVTGSGGGDCGYNFTVGERYLVYANLYQNRLGTSICSRTKPFALANEDLAFLGNLSSAAPGATIQGLVAHPHDPKKDSAPLPPQISVVIAGNNIRREVPLDEQGRYRVAGLPPGKFKVTLKIPETLITDRPEREVTVTDLGCASVYYPVTDNGRVSGRILDTQGQPIPKIMISLFDPASDSKDFIKVERTDDEGRFNLTAVPAGRYLLAVNNYRFRDPQDSTLAYPTAFYPGVLDQVNADLITVGTGEKVTGLNIRMPLPRPASVLTIQIVWDDGSPVAKAQLSLRESTGASDVAFGAVADERGRLKVTSYVGQQIVIDARSNRPYVSAGDRFEPMERTEKVHVTLEKPRETVKVVITKLR